MRSRTNGQHGVLILPTYSKIARQSMKIHSSLNSLGRLLGIFADHGSDGPGQNLSAAALGHSRIARGVDGDAPIRMGDEGAPSFQDEGHGVGSGKTTGQGLPIRLGLA